MNTDEIQVSVSCLAYNHEKYIRKCLDGFVMQKTNFRFEVIVHDDASTDGTAAIIREYAQKYPEIIKPIFQTENQHSQGIKNNLTHVYPRMKGKYVAYCEGDDYWCDENKLQMQYDVMESDESISFSAHRVAWIRDDGQLLNQSYPQVSMVEGVLSSNQILEYILRDNLYLFQTSGYFIRRSILPTEATMPEFMSVSKHSGSVNLLIIAALQGNVYFIDKVMSHYRRFSVGSWKSRQSNVEFRCLNIREAIASRKALDEYLDYRYTEYIQEYILENEFLLHRLENRHDMCLKRKYRKIFHALTLKEKLYIYRECLYKRIGIRKSNS